MIVLQQMNAGEIDLQDRMELQQQVIHDLSGADLRIEPEGNRMEREKLAVADLLLFLHPFAFADVLDGVHQAPKLLVGAHGADRHMEPPPQGGKGDIVETQLT